MQKCRYTKTWKQLIKSAILNHTYELWHYWHDAVHRIIPRTPIYYIIIYKTPDQLSSMVARLGRRPNRHTEDGEHSRTTFGGTLYYVDPHHRLIKGEIAKGIQLPVKRYDGTKTKWFDVSHII